MIAVHAGKDALFRLQQRAQTVIHGIMPRAPRQKQEKYIPPREWPFHQRLVARLQHPVYNFPYELIDAMYFDAQRRPKRVANLGGGPSRMTDFEFVLNIERFENVTLLGDAQRLPFANDSLDGVHANALLEHVEDPRAVAREIYRVLKPGGMVYTIQPWIHPYHAHPRDLHRFSFDTLRLLFGDFETLCLCVNTGPLYTLLKLGETWIINALPELLPFGRRKITAGVQMAYWLGFFWLKYFDRHLFDTSTARILANNTLFMGRKPVTR